MKPPRNAVVGPGATVHMPIGTHAFDWEIELAAVIGRTARNVSVEDALSHVAAYTVAIDFSARDHNRAPETFYKLDWVAGKANDTCCPLGPRLVPASAVADPQNLALKLWVNGQLKQDGHSSQMIFSLAEQIATASRIMTLDPGDLLLTGTPAGVGVPKQTFLKVGDQVDAEIEGIGRLSVTNLPAENRFIPTQRGDHHEKNTDCFRRHPGHPAGRACRAGPKRDSHLHGRTRQRAVVRRVSHDQAAHGGQVPRHDQGLAAHRQRLVQARHRAARHAARQPGDGQPGDF
jgi:hypothetical protein